MRLFRKTRKARLIGVLCIVRPSTRAGTTLGKLLNRSEEAFSKCRQHFGFAGLIDTGNVPSIDKRDIVPLTRRGVVRGNKVFGAAILRKADLSLVLAETNNEIENPLWHGEMHAIKKLYEGSPAERPDPRDCVFLATHEPCSLCLSAITWAGCDAFFYLFSHEDSRDSFAIPHDIRILTEVFRPRARRSTTARTPSGRHGRSPN